MDPRDLVQSNRYLGPASFSADLVYILQAPTTNWGVPSEQRFVVKLSPQVGEGSGGLVLSDIYAEEGHAVSLKRRLRRELMGNLTNEFTSMRDQLLRDLAR
jgi:hypothetical protein